MRLAGEARCSGLGTPSPGGREGIRARLESTSNCATGPGGGFESKLRWCVESPRFVSKTCRFGATGFNTGRKIDSVEGTNMALRINFDAHTIADLAALGSTILDLGTATYHSIQWIWAHLGSKGATTLSAVSFGGDWYCACRDQGLTYIDCRIDYECACNGLCPEARRAMLDTEAELKREADEERWRDAYALSLPTARSAVLD